MAGEAEFVFAGSNQLPRADDRSLEIMETILK